MLELLEGTWERLEQALPTVPERVSVVVHGSDLALAAAMPLVPLVRLATAPAARRYVVGWPTTGTIHVLAPRVLRDRASNASGSRDLALLAPAALLAQVLVRHANPAMRPTAVRWAWAFHGAGQYLSGQTEHARGPIGRRLREGGEPRFPPGPRDALLLGGSVLDLLAQEHGPRAALAFVVDPPDGSPERALVRAFGARSIDHVQGPWRAHLARLAGAA